MLRRAILSLAIAACVGAALRPDYFSEEDRQRVAASWAEVSYEVSDAPSGGRWQVRLTPEASEWLFRYNKARGIGKGANLEVGSARNGEQAAWNRWIEAKASYDRAVAAERARLLNAANAERDQLSEEDQAALERAITTLKSHSPTPSGLAELAGEPPDFAAVVRPRTYTIYFPGDEPITLTNNVATSPKSAYYRFPQGVRSGGTPVSDLDPVAAEELRAEAGIDETAWRVLCAVASMEGGFDSINTYDTGYVSAGLLQFTAGEAGGGSLGRVLLRMKEETPEAFDSDFRAFGLDVDEEGKLIALDENATQELTGTDAVFEIIEDPRLAALFIRAGRHQAFQVSQIKSAMENYYPAEEPLRITLNGTQLTVLVGDIVRSEEGLATLMDRKVHTGRLDNLAAVVSRVAAETGANSVPALAAQESKIIAAMRYRKDFRNVASLTKAGSGRTSSTRGAASRGGKRPR